MSSWWRAREVTVPSVVRLGGMRLAPSTPAEVPSGFLFLPVLDFLGAPAAYVIGK